jgi:EmrB/QacA subfamily drug resistance transporter
MHMRRYLVFIIAGLSLLLISVSSTAVSVAFPSIILDLDTSLVLAGWMLTAYQLTFIALVPLAGKITESFGRRSTLMLFISLFTLGSVLCSVAPNIYMLIAFRIIQAIGGSGLVPCVTEIVSEEFPDARQRSIGLLSSIFPVGMIIGPNLGGVLVESLGWRSVFWINIPPGVAVIALAWLLLQGGRRQHKNKIDIAGASLLFTSLLAIMVCLTNLSEINSGIDWTLTGSLFITAIILLVIFVRWERKIAEPIIDMELLKERRFLASNIYNTLYGAGALGVVVLIPFYAVSVYGMSTFESGFILTPRSIAMVITSAITSFALVKWGYRRPILAGTLAIALSLFLLGLELHEINIFGMELNVTVLILIIMLISGIGIGVVSPAANNACIELMPDKVATITGLRIMFRQAGGAIGIASSTVVIHLIGNAPEAFKFLMLAWTAIMIISIIPIMFMPENPKTEICTSTKKVTYGDSTVG